MSEQANPATANTDAAAAVQTPESVLYPTEIKSAAPSAEPVKPVVESKPEGNADAEAVKSSGDVKAKPEDGLADKTDVVPETYDAFQVPEGMTLDTAMVEKAAPLFKELGLSQDKAQKLVSMYAGSVNDAAQAQREALAQTYQQWADDARADKEYGGTPEKFAESAAMARAALERFGSKELKAFLNSSGVGNHPEVIRAFYKIGKQISPDTAFPGSNSPASGQKDHASILYPNEAAQAR